MKILVLSEEYPNNEGIVTLMYIHTRNLYYQNHGIDVTELNFRAKKSYVYQGVNVITLSDFIESDDKYDLLVIHSANLKHHYRFLKKYGDKFPHFLFFYHGHEVLKRRKVYAKPYPYVVKNKRKEVFDNLYDTFKLFVWRKYIPKVAYKSWFVFVSNWMYEEFLKWTCISPDILKNRYSITYNCVGKTFERSCYDLDKPKSYDFVTIRSNLDGSKYGIDIVNILAERTPEAKFLVVGKGEFFSHYKKADNITWENKTLQHNEIIEVLNSAKFALMPTRTDAQGLMMCEMAAFGIPVITSDIPVCHEVFDGFDNVFFIDNETENSLERFLRITPKCIRDTRFYESNTAQKEAELIKRLVSIGEE